jgi:hypothetical protein
MFSVFVCPKGEKDESKFICEAKAVDGGWRTWDFESKFEKD